MDIVMSVRRIKLWKYMKGFFHPLFWLTDVFIHLKGQLPSDIYEAKREQIPSDSSKTGVLCVTYITCIKYIYEHALRKDKITNYE